MAQRLLSRAVAQSRNVLEHQTRWMACAAMPQPVHDDFPSEKEGKVLHPDLLNESVKRTQYAVRGELYLRAMELQKQGKKIIFTNGAPLATPRGAASVGHPHAKQTHP